MPRRRILASTALMVAALILTACSNGTDTTTEGTATTAAETSQQTFNDADVTFAQQMIPHHQQAVQMAQLASAAAGSDEVRQLAADIEQAQQPEIETMTQWLEEWGEDVPDATASMGGMEHGASTGGMPGMMGDDDMAALGNAHGADFDTMFLTMMIAHHESAVDMAEIEQRDGQHPDAVALAKRIEADQTAEIEKMRALLGAT